MFHKKKKKSLKISHDCQRALSGSHFILLLIFENFVSYLLYSSSAQVIWMFLLNVHFVDIVCTLSHWTVNVIQDSTGINQP